MSLFTVEQLELIRRLRTTGISSEQVLKAFTELEKVDREETNNNIDNESSSSSSSRSSPPTPELLVAQSPPASMSVVTVPNASSADSPPPTLIAAGSSSPLPPQPPPPPPPPPPTAFEQMSQGPPRPIRSQRTPMKEITTLDNPNELDEFMTQGEEACIADMRAFITQYSLRQTTVAMMTGVSQPYISKLLNGNHRELSLRCRKNIYCWYLNCRRHPEKLAAFLADPSTRLETNCDGELIPQRRERYVFRPILIRMLESFFAQTPFPDLQRRIEIATACNHVLSLDKKGVGLMPKEIVSPQVVSNWFANKRKELRRKNAENYSSSGFSNTGNSTNNDCTSGSVSSMSPPSRDEENGSRALSPTVSACQNHENTIPFDLSVSSSTPVTPTTTTMSTAGAVDIFAVAKRLGFQLPSLPLIPDANFAANLMNVTPFLPFSMFATTSSQANVDEPLMASGFKIE
ncbi:unnamed protein product [Caenorhabditis bovis]|uniref:Homeobox domain-containing protein n=1 Tax=Caenorhabditis bovis TaxID=2654633 RepID=A0A8S1F4X7_9PELO|nr:unnamed protein product [Caenorhabditis bovis]